MKTIKVNVSKDGSQVKIAVEGVAGSACEELTQGLENAIYGGGQTSERTHEFYQEEVNNINTGV